MPTISVITAVDPATAFYLPVAYQSLAHQTLPPDWDWEWLVQCDSVAPEHRTAVAALLPDDARITFAASRRGGPGIARTMALARATGVLVKVLDADDQLTPGALARDITACREDGVGWSVSHVLDISDDGSLVDHRQDVPSGGRLKSGAVYAYWRQHDCAIWVHPATLCVRRWLLLALGGWMALPASEDTGLLMALDAVSDGWFSSTPGMHYRRWPQQMSASDAHADPDELAARRALIAARADALELLLDAW